jgi:hypothetical protein
MQIHRYFPVEGGWRIGIGRWEKEGVGSGEIGVCVDDPRGHCRPLYPVADRGVFDGKVADAEEVDRLSMRAVVVAYNAPRFEFDFHHAGGALGELRVGLALGGGEARCLNGWSEIEVGYVYGRMEYVLRDPELPGVTVNLRAVALADALGAGFKWEVRGAQEGALVVFGFTAPGSEKMSMACGAGGLSMKRTFDAPVKGGTNLSKTFYPTGWEAVVVSRWTAAEDKSHGSVQSKAGKKHGGEKDGGLVEAIWRTVEMTGCLVLGMGRGMEGEPEAMFERAVKRGEEIGGRVKVKTPSAHLNAAVTTMAYGLEGIWGDLAYLHGAWSWRFAYLGWRTWYGPNCYGWSERVKRAIRNHIRLSLFKDGEDRGGIGSIIEFDVPVVYYNMNEVFLDMVRHYFDHTDDVALMREIFPVLEGVIAWEKRRLKPTEEALYENSLNTWISDSHWMVQGQGTQASAYMLGAHTFMERLAKHLGKDGEPWKKEAQAIREAMQRRLWQRRRGMFAEGRDTRGHKQVHPEPELPTLYHSAEFGAADALQIYQMLRWAQTHLPREETAGGGVQYWSSNWRPNEGRSFTHSTYELAFAENLNFALTHYLAGQAEEGWALIKGTLCGVFNGPTPGGLSCHAERDGRQRRNDEFADTMSMWGRAVVEGMFGVVIKRPEGMVELSPQFPEAWDEAEIQTPHFAYRWRREGGKEVVEWKSPVATGVRLRLPVKAERIMGAGGRYELVAGVGLTWVVMEGEEGVCGRFEVCYQRSERAMPEERVVKVGERFEVEGGGAMLDPQGILKDGVVTGEGGPGVVFSRKEGGGDVCPVIVPYRLRVKGGEEKARRWLSPGFASEGRRLERWKLVDLSGVFNTPLMEAMGRAKEAMKAPEAPASGINFEYRGGHMSARMKSGAKLEMSDAAWRAKVGPDGVAWTHEGIPFKTAATGDNIAVVTLEGGFPEAVRFAVGAQGKTLYLMLSGVTWPMQSHVVNLRVTVEYQGGLKQVHDLVNPADIGDCWDTWLGSFHDSMGCGFENIGGRFGVGGSNEVADLSVPVEVDTEANLVAIELQEGLAAAYVTVEAVANDIVFGVMGASVRR